MLIYFEEGIQMATVFDVAKYILDKAGSMSAMKLQKLVFYSQAMSLVWDDLPLFDDDFEAWDKGPVCRALFNAHRGMFLLKDSNFLENEHPDISRLSQDQKETIDAVLRGLGDYSPYELSSMTHNEEPWIKARNGCSMGVRCDNVISKESMQEYYSRNW